MEKMCRGPTEAEAAPASKVRMSHMHLTYLRLWYGRHRLKVRDGKTKRNAFIKEV